MKRSQSQRSTVRFSDDEYLQVASDAGRHKMSIPEIMKAVYFKALPKSPLFNRDDAQMLLVAINRLGNNVNQIARHLNSGFSAAGLPETLEKIDSELAQLSRTLMVNCGGR